MLTGLSRTKATSALSQSITGKVHFVGDKTNASTRTQSSFTQLYADVHDT
jgi:hypothetical protein